MTAYMRTVDGGRLYLVPQYLRHPLARPLPRRHLVDEPQPPKPPAPQLIDTSQLYRQLRTP